MKKVVMFLISLFMINLINAYSYGYGDGVLSRFLNAIDASTMVLGFVFILSFFFVFIGLSSRKVGKQNRAGVGVLAFLIALFITWGVNKSGLDFKGFFLDLGISEDFLYTVLPLILLGLLIFLGIILGFGASLFIIGLFLFIASFFIYEGSIIMITGIILSIIGGIIWYKWPKKKSYPKTVKKMFPWLSSN